MSSQWTSHPEKGKPYGMVDRITIQNDKGTEEHGELNKTGKVLKKHTRTLKQKDIQALLSPTSRKAKNRKSTRRNK
jgi:hypothetical protein